MNSLRRLVLLAITVCMMYVVVGCQGYNSTMMFTNNNTYGDMQLQDNRDIVPQLENEEKQKYLPRIKSALSGYNIGYEHNIVDGCLNGNADPYFITVLINLMTVDGTSEGADMTNNLLGIEDSIDFAESRYGASVLKKFNNKADSINYAINKLKNTWTREYNLMTIEENFQMLYPDWERFKQHEDTREQYDRVISILYRDYAELKGEEYKTGGIN